MDGGHLRRKQERRQSLIWPPANHSVAGLGTAARLGSSALCQSLLASGCLPLYFWAFCPSSFCGTMMSPEQYVITPGVVVPEPPPAIRDPEASTSRANVIPPYDDLDADPPLPVETRPGKRKKKVTRCRSAPPPDADETDSADADHEGQGGILLVTEVETADPHPDAEKGNRPVDGPVSWQEDPCRSCHRPYNTAPPREVWVAYGMDAQGRIIEYKYIRARTADGTSRRLRPEDAWKFDVQGARITEDGMCKGIHVRRAENRNPRCTVLSESPIFESRPG